MENRRHVIFFMISLVGALLFATPVLTSAYGVTTHALLTEEIVKFANHSFSDIRLNANDQASIVQGAIDEDNGTRWLQHFYDPVHNRGLTFGSDKPVNRNLAFVGSAPIKSQWKSAKDWAMDTSSQAGVATLFSGITGNYFGGNDDYSWERGIYEYAWGNKKRGLESLGHILHLIEDASVPDHTRNDPHPALGRKLQENLSFLAKPVIIAYLGNHNTTNSSPYESFVTFGPGSVTIADKLKLENRKPVILTSLIDYFDGMARYSNKNFFSKDTIFSEEYQKSEIIFSKVEEMTNGDLIKFLYTSDGSSSFRLVGTLPTFGWHTSLAKSEKSFIDDFDNLIVSDYWSLLSQQAVLHGAGVVKLFFDGVEKEKKTKTLYNKNRSWVGKRYDRFKQTAFGAVSLLYGSSVKQRDLDDDSPPPSMLPIIQPSALLSAQPPVSISPSSSPSIFPSVTSLPSVAVPLASTSSPAPQTGVQSQRPSSPAVSVVSRTSASRGSGNFGSAHNSSNKIVATPSPAASVSSSPSPTPSPSPTTSVSPSSSPTPSPSNSTTPSPSPSPTPTTTPAADTQPPSLIFAITECAASLSPASCLIATTTITLTWSSPDTDLANYKIECTTNSIACANFSFASTTATSTIYIAPNDATTYIFKATAIDTSGNTSAAQIISVDVWLRPVVINEIAWAGTGSSPVTSKDEWIELYNPTSQIISLSNMLLNSSTNNSFNINLTGAIASHGYYLIERTDDNAIIDITADLTATFGSGLSNNGEQLMIQLGSTTIDATPPAGTCYDGWCAGSASGQYYTMERYDPLSPGENQTNWGSWQNIVQYGTNAEAQSIKGTPKQRNAINYLIVNNSTNLAINKTLTKANSPYVVSGQTSVSQSATLTIEPGVIIKFKGTGSELYGNGVISAIGTTADPIIFTSFADDTYAGDTNQNGTTTLPQAGDWGLIRLFKNGSVIDHAIVRYGGEDLEKASIKVKNADANITNSTIEQSKYYGISFENSTGAITSNIIRDNTAQNNSESTGIFIFGNGIVTVSANTFMDNYAGLRISSSGINNVSVTNNTFTHHINEAITAHSSYPSFSGNIATGNGINGIVLQAVAYEDDVLEKDLPYVVSDSNAYMVTAGKKVTIMPGVIIKFGSGSYINVVGALEAKGTAASPIVFTSLHDDDCGIAGGCGNTDNASTTPQAGDWSMMRFEPASGPSHLEYATVRYSGYYFYGNKGAIQLYNNASLTVSHSTVEKNYYAGMQIDHASPIISDSLIQDHKGTPSVGQFYGLSLTASSTPTIANTHLKNNDVHIFNDITSSYVDGGGNVME